jgi:hypothetical protein
MVLALSTFWLPSYRCLSDLEVLLHLFKFVYKAWEILYLFKASEITGPHSLATSITFYKSFPAMTIGVSALKNEIQSEKQTITFTNLPVKNMQVTLRRGIFF